MTESCPPKTRLDRLLADELTKDEEEAMEAHVAGCPECQHRLERLTHGVLELPDQTARIAHDRTNERRPGHVLEYVANLDPARVQLFAQGYKLKDESAGAQSPELQRAANWPPDFSSLPSEERKLNPTRAPPFCIGRYELRSLLGSGGCGSVYLAYDQQLDRPVAIKVFRGGTESPVAEGDRLFQEARRLAHLHHPAIVTVHDLVVHDGHLCVVSDFIHGPQLGDWLRDTHPHWQVAADITATLAEGLAHAHGRRIIHRDVKPANILLTNGHSPVLVDFGLALDEACAGGCQIGVVSGTPHYMSPEQVAGLAHRIDGRTDIYSLGVVLYELLCSRVPFMSDDLGELLRQIQDDEPQPLRQLVPGLPAELERICLKALSKRPQDRYSTATDLAADLRCVIQAEPTTPSSTTLPPASLAGDRQPASDKPPSQRRTRDAELRQVTVLSCGCALFDSEEYARVIDTEDQARLIRSFQQSCEQAVRRFDGTIVQCNQQGLLVCFGYPVAYEDSARRAAQAGLDILDTMKNLAEQLKREHNLELDPRVSIHTGPALVETSENAVSLVGEAPNIAVWLKDAAERGQVVCTDSTQRLIKGHFELADLGSRRVKGVLQPVALFAVQAAAILDDPLEARGAKLTPLVGREHEVNLLLDRWEQACEGMGQVVLIVGEPGVGKSRLVHTLKRHVQNCRDGANEVCPRVASRRAPDGHEALRDGTIIEWRCSPCWQNTTLYPARSGFERFLGLACEEAPAARFDRLVDRLAEYDLARPEIVPLFASLFGLPTDQRFPPLQLSPIQEREKTFWALRELILACAERQPVLFVVGDLHWVDASTLEFVRQFLTLGQHDGILTILTFRPEFQASWSAVAHQTCLALNRLTRNQVIEMMRRDFGVEILPEVLVDLVYDRTGGVPLFVEEYMHLVQQSGLLNRLEGDCADSWAQLAREIPAALDDLVMARLDRLSCERGVAQLAAALGREFSYDLLAAVTTLDEPTLQAELAKLVQGEILHQKGRWPKCNYIFKHALLQACVYKTLVKDKRQQFHHRIAEVLEAQSPQAAHTKPEFLVRHYTEAGLIEKAVACWLFAAEQSRQRSANIEAIYQLTQGVALLGKLPESPGRDALELKFLNLLSSAYIAGQGYSSPEVGPILRRARELCERMGQPSERLAVLRSAWVWHVVHGNYRQYTQTADEAMDVAQRSNTPGLLMEALLLVGVTSYYRGEFAGTRAACTRAVTDYDDRARTRFWAQRFGEDSGIVHRCFLSLALWHLGYPEQALKINDEALQLARAIGEPCDLCLALIHKCLLYWHCRLPSKDAVEEAIRIAIEKGLPFWHVAGTLLKATESFSGERRAEAAAMLQRGIDAYRAAGFRAWLPFHLGTLVQAYTQAGRFYEAEVALNEGLAAVEENNERFHEAELHRLRGELLLASTPERTDAVEDCFHCAIHTSRLQQSRALELRATISLARLWQRQGLRDEAHAALAAVYGTYTEGFTMPDLMDASALLQNSAS